MAWRLLAGKGKNPRFPCLLQNPNPSFPISTLPHLNAKKRKKRKKKESPRTKLVQHESHRLPHFEEIVQRESLFRFLTRTKDFLSRQPEHVLRLDDAGKLYRELGFPRGRKVTSSIARHPLLLQTYRHTDGKSWFGFTDLMEDLLLEEKSLMEATEPARITTVRKLLMISKDKKIPLSTIYHCRHLFGISDDFRDRVSEYPDYFRVVVDPTDGRRILELVGWDSKLAVSALERDFVPDEDRVRRTFKFPVPQGKSLLGLDEDDERRMNLINTLPLISPYSDHGPDLKLWSLEAEKYRVGVLHEFLSLTLEKRASIHHIVEFKDEFSLTKHTYQLLLKQPRAFYLAGTEMNWMVFLREGYTKDGTLMLGKDPQVVFNEKLHHYALMTKIEPGHGLTAETVCAN